MSHTYPIASDATAALTVADLAARTRFEAERAIPDGHIESLATEWLTPKAGEVAGWQARIEAGPGHGFVQQYEDASGNAVFAVTYWKLVAASGTEPKALPPQSNAMAETPAAYASADDDTDDLYFRQKPRKRRRKKPIDKNQLDLFAPPADES